MGLGEIGLKGEGFVVTSDGLIQLPQVLEHSAKVVMRLGIIRLES